MIIHNNRKDTGLGNQFFINMCVYMLSKKYKVNANYLNGGSNICMSTDFNEHNNKNYAFRELGIFLNEKDNGLVKENNNKKIILDQTDLLGLLNDEIKFDYQCDYILHQKSYFQRGKNNEGDEIPKKILKIFNQKSNELRIKIIENNFYKKRYNNNNDLVIHLRIRHPLHLKNKASSSVYDGVFPIDHYDWYEKLIKQINYDNIYICSDTENCSIVKKLKENFNAKFVNFNSVETLKFASTCKHVILSWGTYSWLLGLFSFYSNVYYFDFNNNPTTRKNKKFMNWGNCVMYFASNWNKIDLA